MGWSGLERVVKARRTIFFLFAIHYAFAFLVGRYSTKVGSPVSSRHHGYVKRLQ